MRSSSRLHRPTSPGMEAKSCKRCRRTDSCTTNHNRMWQTASSGIMNNTRKSEMAKSARRASRGSSHCSGTTCIQGSTRSTRQGIQSKLISHPLSRGGTWPKDWEGLHPRPTQTRPTPTTMRTRAMIGFSSRHKWNRCTERTSWSRRSTST